MEKPVVVVLCAMWISIGLVGIGAGISKREMSWMGWVVLVAGMVTYDLMSKF